MKLEPKAAIHMEKLLLTAVKWWDGASGNLLGRANSASQVDGVSGMAPTCWFCGSVGILVGEKAVPQLSP